MRIAVTGASGGLGRQVVDLLAEHGGHQVVALWRRPPPGPPRPRVETAIADYLDLPALRTAFRDIDTLVFISSDGESHRLLHHHAHVVRAASDCGVGHVVALSSVDADLESPFCYAVTNRQTELLLEDGGLASSVARASIYTGFFRHWIDLARRTGELRVPGGAGRIGLVSRDDVGRALAALALGDPTCRHHDLTGPEALDLTAIAERSSAADGTPRRYVDLAPAEYAAEMARDGVDPWWAYAYTTMFASIREQRWDVTSDEVADLTGRPPVSLDEVLAGDLSPPGGR
jgi:NAD(P)H dehydrogenase (quinone)